MPKPNIDVHVMSGTLREVLEQLGAKTETVESTMSDLLRQLRDKQEEESAEHVDCNCTACQTRRFQVPKPNDGEVGLAEIVVAIAETHEVGVRTEQVATKICTDFILHPLPAAAEDAIMQMYVDRANAAMRCEQALNALLPAEKRMPERVQLKPKTLDEAREAMRTSRIKTQALWDQRKLNEQLKNDAKSAAAGAQNETV